MCLKIEPMIKERKYTFTTERQKSKRNENCSLYNVENLKKERYIVNKNETKILKKETFDKTC